MMAHGLYVSRYFVPLIAAILGSVLSGTPYLELVIGLYFFSIGMQTSNILWEWSLRKRPDKEPHQRMEDQP